MRELYEYNVSFETDGKRIKAQQLEFNIHDVIKRVRKDYPDAKMFIVLNKMKQPHPIYQGKRD